MGEIINWLRGDKIAIMTLLQLEHDSNIPKVFHRRPKVAQWVISHDDNEIRSSIEQLVGSIATEFDGDSNYDLRITQNDDIRSKTPDCSLVVDIIDDDMESVMFRIYLTGFIKKGGKWE